MKSETKDWVQSITGEHHVEGDPQFIDPAHGDFRLLSNSPALHAGHGDVEYANSDGSSNTIGAVQGEFFKTYNWWKVNFPPQIID